MEEGCSLSYGARECTVKSANLERGEEVEQVSVEGGGLFDVGEVTGVRDDGRRRAGDLVGHVGGGVEEAPVVRSGDDQGRNSDGGERVDHGGVGLGQDPSSGERRFFMAAKRKSSPSSCNCRSICNTPDLAQPASGIFGG